MEIKTILTPPRKGFSSILLSFRIQYLGAPSGFGDLERMAIHFQGAGEH